MMANVLCKRCLGSVTDGRYLIDGQSAFCLMSILKRALRNRHLGRMIDGSQLIDRISGIDLI